MRRKRRRATRVAANKVFREAVAGTHECFKKLCKPNAAQTRNDLAALINLSLDARSKFKKAREQINDAYGVEAKQYQTTLLKYDDAIMDVIIDVQRAPHVSPLMRTYEIRLDVLSEFLKLLTEYLEQPEEFERYFVRSQSGLAGRLAKLIVMKRGLQPSSSTYALAELAI